MSVDEDSVVATLLTAAPSDNGDVQARVADLFDNEALWDADDTDDIVLQLFRDLEVAGAHLATARDLGANSLLHMAALWNRRTIMEEMVRRGAELNVTNKNGHTALDLASHWGHFDLAMQLQHYGGKHTCESERDVAIAQRDLAQQRNDECEAEMQEALQRLQYTKHEREAFRVERDRLVQLHSDAVRTCNQQAEQLQRLKTTMRELTDEKHELRIRAAQLTDELGVEQAARSNAIQGWQIAEQVIADMQVRHEECREREEEALAMRNDALAERNVARELARQAQLDQGLARQQQVDADRERERALTQLLDAENDIARDKELWRTKAAKIELERRNIQVEIDRQTELLRNENTKLEKQVAVLMAANALQRQQLDSVNAALASAHKESTLQQRDLSVAAERLASLEAQVRELQDERRSEHRAWRQRIEQSLQLAIAAELRSMLEAAVTTWRKLCECQERVYRFDVAALDAAFSSSSSTCSSNSESLSPATNGGSSLRLSTALSASMPLLLPVIQDKSTSSVRDMTAGTPRTTHALGPIVTTTNNTPGFVAHNYDPPLRFTADNRIQTRLHSAEDALRLATDELSLNTVAEHVTALCASIAAHLDALTTYALKYFEHFRKQAQMQEKLIERKDELIQRFTQHRQDKPKKSTPARFRDCSVRPTI